MVLFVHLTNHVQFHSVLQNVIFWTFTGIVNWFLCASLVLAVVFSGIKVMFFGQWTYFVPDHIYIQEILCLVPCCWNNYNVGVFLFNVSALTLCVH